MSIDREERRQNIRAEVKKLMEARERSAPAALGTHDLVDHVVEILVDMIADLQCRVEDLERRLSDPTMRSLSTHGIGSK